MVCMTLTTLYKPTQLHMALYDPRILELVSLILTLRRQ